MSGHKDSGKNTILSPGASPVFPLAAAAADASLNADAARDAAEVDDRAAGDPAAATVTPRDNDGGAVGSDETIPTTALLPRHAPNGYRLIGVEELALHI